MRRQHGPPLRVGPWHHGGWPLRATLEGATQLVIYIDDHGDTEFDWWEWVTETVTDLVLDPIAGWAETATLHDGWEPGLLEMFNQPANTPAPWLTIGVDPRSQRSLLPQDWQVQLNGHTIPLLNPIAPGQSMQLPVDWTAIQNGPNTLQFLPNLPSGGAQPVILSALELGSGPISESEDDAPMASTIPEPATMCALAMAVTGLGGYLRRRRRAA